MNPQQLSISFSTANYKYRFVQGFLKALKRINRRKTTTLSSPREICRRYLKVKSAADASMASAVGFRRAWSRALLQKIRVQDQKNKFGHKYPTKRRSSAIYTEKNHNKNDFSEAGREHDEKINGINWKANELRKLVPGGEAMDMCNLLDETAHYIKCLAAQVKLMRRIADFASA